MLPWQRLEMWGWMKYPREAVYGAGFDLIRSEEGQYVYEGVEDSRWSLWNITPMIFVNESGWWLTIYGGL